MEFNFGADDSLGDLLAVEDNGNDDQLLDSEGNINVFKEMMEGIECDYRVGKAINSMAELFNALQSKKMSKNFLQVKYDKYIRPKNVEFAEAPIANKPNI